MRTLPMNKYTVSCCSLPAGLGSVLTVPMALHSVASLEMPCLGIAKLQYRPSNSLTNNGKNIQPLLTIH